MYTTLRKDLIRAGMRMGEKRKKAGKKLPPEVMAKFNKTIDRIFKHHAGKNPTVTQGCKMVMDTLEARMYLAKKFPQMAKKK